MSASQNRKVLEIIKTDNTFKVETLPRTGDAWVGKCFYCRTKIVVSMDGSTDGTIEHILARHQGGTDDLHNIALACKSCNQEKGRRHDVKKKVNQALLDAGVAERTKRWREAP